jgi:hypothetical protein
MLNNSSEASGHTALKWSLVTRTAVLAMAISANPRCIAISIFRRYIGRQAFEHPLLQLCHGHGYE